MALGRSGGEATVRMWQMMKRKRVCVHSQVSVGMKREAEAITIPMFPRHFKSTVPETGASSSFRHDSFEAGRRLPFQIFVPATCSSHLFRSSHPFIHSLPHISTASKQARSITYDNERVVKFNNAFHAR